MKKLKHPYKLKNVRMLMFTMKNKQLSRVDILLDFFKEIEKMKLILRRTVCSDGKRRESAAEHSWHLAMFLILFQKDLPKIDLLKTLKMILIHDLVEIYAGDTFLFDHRGRKTQKMREKRAAKKLFSKLPKDLEKEFVNLFNEFEANKTKESQIAKSLDKIQPIIQGVLGGGPPWKKYQITEELIHEYKHRYMLHSPLILRLYQKAVQEAKDKKFI